MTPEISQEGTKTRRPPSAAVARWRPILRVLVSSCSIPLFLSACCSLPPLAPLPRIAAPPAPATRVQALLAELRGAQAPVHTLKVVHHITVQAEGRPSTGAMQGLLAVRRPDAYRLRVLGPAGITAMDLAWRSGRFVLTVPPRGVRVDGDERTPREQLRGVPVDGLARAFLGTFDATRAALVEDARWSLLTLVEPGGARRKLFVDRRNGTVAVDARFEGGAETTRLTQGGYRQVGGVWLPFRVRFDMPAQRVVATITVDRYDVNPALPDAAFRLP